MKKRTPQRLAWLKVNEGSCRYSQDLDFFHDLAESIATSAALDAAALAAAGYDLEWLLQTPAFYRAVVRDGRHALKLEWAQDSAFRFFPVVAGSRSLLIRIHRMLSRCTAIWAQYAEPGPRHKFAGVLVHICP